MKTCRLYLRSMKMLMKCQFEYPVSFFLQTLAQLIMEGGEMMAVILIINRLIYPDLPLGWSSTMCAMVFLFGIVLMVLGIIGEYLGKIILILNNTPQYVVREAVNLGGFRKGMVRESIQRQEGAGEGTEEQ